MNVTWKMVALGSVGIIAVTTIAAVAVANGIDGAVVKLTFAAIGGIVAGLGGYTIGIKRRIPS